MDGNWTDVTLAHPANRVVAKAGNIWAKCRHDAVFIHILKQVQGGQVPIVRAVKRG